MPKNRTCLSSSDLASQQNQDVPFLSSVSDIRSSPSVNYTDRKPQLVVIHYTEGSTEQSLQWLQKPGGPSAHYLITPEGEIHQLVAEQHRAWHAGAGHWKQFHDINSVSLGIELVNYGFDGPHVPATFSRDELVSLPGSSKKWFPYPKVQIEALAALLRDMVNRWSIPPQNIIGHSDMAPSRKIDPGPCFPWKHIHDDFQLGAWPDMSRKLKFVSLPLSTDNKVLWVQKHLLNYGYPMTLSGTLDQQTQDCLCAFYMHFCADYIDDFSHQSLDHTITILAHLVDQYYYGAMHYGAM